MGSDPERSALAWLSPIHDKLLKIKLVMFEVTLWQASTVGAESW